METTHRVAIEDARQAASIPAESVDLVVTSPPYPMVEMWDGTFAALEPRVGEALRSNDGDSAFDAMHGELDRVWEQCARALRPGGLVCINIGDATRTIDGEFRLWSNHARILVALARLGFSALPDIIWRKPTNAPNKFLGSGMLPAGAYVTYEHEYVLIARKGARRQFVPVAAKENRRRSAYFWEERNAWFSDVWFDLRGSRQDLVDAETRARSGAFPFELAYRLIQMHSVYGDTVLDPFLGTGTTMVAALASGRSSRGIEIDAAFADLVRARLKAAPCLAAERLAERLRTHEEFVAARRVAGKALRHRNVPHDIPVITRQETALEFLWPGTPHEVEPGSFVVEHAPRDRTRQAEFAFDRGS